MAQVGVGGEVGVAGENAGGVLAAYAQGLEVVVRGFGGFGGRGGTGVGRGGRWGGHVEARAARAEVGRVEGRARGRQGGADKGHG